MSHGGYLGKEIDLLRVHDRTAWIVSGEISTERLAVRIVGGAGVLGEMRRFMNDSPSLGVGAF